MNTSILFSVWLNKKCTIQDGAYIYNDRYYYTEDVFDMNTLLDFFFDSDFYKNSIGTKTLLNDARLLSQSIDSLFYADYHKASKLANLGDKAKDIVSDMEGCSF